jgi:hypothetical protein
MNSGAEVARKQFNGSLQREKLILKPSMGQTSTWTLTLMFSALVHFSATTAVADLLSSATVRLGLLSLFDCTVKTVSIWKSSTSSSPESRDGIAPIVDKEHTTNDYQTVFSLSPFIPWKILIDWAFIKSMLFCA